MYHNIYAERDFESIAHIMQPKHNEIVVLSMLRTCERDGERKITKERKHSIVSGKSVGFE